MDNNDIVFSLPALSLRPYITHYWLSRNNHDSHCPILPDGTIDVVFNIRMSGSINRVYGAVTHTIDYPLDLGSRYLGINFKPGQSRHFLTAAANEFTDYYEAAEETMALSFNGVEETLCGGNIFRKLDVLLESHLQQKPPSTSPIDRLIKALEVHKGQLSLAECAHLYGKSIRQLQRDFIQAVGISVKLYAQIIRFHFASKELLKGHHNLAGLAASLGYTDQSHMNRDFRRFTELSPLAFSASDAAFIQDRYFRFLDNRF